MYQEKTPRPATNKAGRECLGRTVMTDYNIQIFAANSKDELERLEKNHRKKYYEELAFAMNTPFVEIAEKNGHCINKWQSPFYYIVSSHKSAKGIQNICKLALAWYNNRIEEGMKLDVLSISAGMKEGTLTLKVLIRYREETAMSPEFILSLCKDLEVLTSSETKIIQEEGRFFVPDELKAAMPTKEDIRQRLINYEEQQKWYDSATEDKPFLNQLSSYTPSRDFDYMESPGVLYMVKSQFAEVELLTPRDKYRKVFEEIINTCNGVEYYSYIHALEDEESEKDFMKFIKNNEIPKYIDQGMLRDEDVSALLDEVYNALFKLYILQELIDDDKVSDIIISAYDDIRCRVRGKTYQTNLSFVDESDYLRMVTAITNRTHTKLENPEQTFTYSNDERFILRMSVSSAYVNSVPWHYMHIRKVPRKKLLGDDLIKAGMMTPVVRDYLLDCARTSRGVVFAGPPGSGKTYALNWFLEEGYESTCDILVIQENDELFAYRKGVRFQHVVLMPRNGMRAVSLKELGELALVEGANVFVIGEAKSGEICSAITLSNSGCRTALTLHSPSSTETIDKMADLAMKGMPQTFEQAKRSLKAFQTIVYLEDFKIKEISEITGYDEVNGNMIYKPIYRYKEDSANEAVI